MQLQKRENDVRNWRNVFFLLSRDFHLGFPELVNKKDSATRFKHQLSDIIIFLYILRRSLGIQLYPSILYRISLDVNLQDIILLHTKRQFCSKLSLLRYKMHSCSLFLIFILAFSHGLKVKEGSLMEFEEDVDNLRIGTIFNFKNLVRQLNFDFYLSWALYY